MTLIAQVKTARYFKAPQHHRIIMASTINITVDGIPDGARDIVLNKSDGTPVINESVTVTGGKITFDLPTVNPGETLKGYAHDGLATILRAAYLEGVTISDSGIGELYNTVELFNTVELHA